MDKKAIANIFNDYFVNIARGLNEITGDYGRDFASHPSNYDPSIIAIHNNNTERSVKDLFSFQLSSKTQVEHLLLQMNTSKSCGHSISSHHVFLRTRQRLYLLQSHTS